MKRLLLLTSIGFSLGLQAQMKAPSAVSKAFEQRFANAKHVKWGKENAKEYEADFVLNGIKMSANFDLQGNWKETETEIAITQLPVAVSSSVREHYQGSTIEGASKIEKPDGKIIYETDLKWKGKKKEVELYPDGKLVK
ncbi:MAG: PepSY-like domain-containing protein [Bacteroidetes bacterium]|nr:PepSY-like domain-containing protein [Bacteroidota bacterium]